MRQNKRENVGKEKNSNLRISHVFKHRKLIESSMRKVNRKETQRERQRKRGGEVQHAFNSSNSRE